jgi:hypothetical protein
VHSETLSQNKQTQGEEMNQALYAHMKNKRKMKKNEKQTNKQTNQNKSSGQTCVMDQNAQITPIFIFGFCPITAMHIFHH